MSKATLAIILILASLASAFTGYLQGLSNGKKEGINFIEKCFAVLSQSSPATEEPGLIIKKCIDAGSETVGVWHIANPQQQPAAE